MSQFSDFAIGDRAHHRARKESGTVIAIDYGDVVVQFDKPTPQGKKSLGRYDANWFRLCGDLLVKESP